MIQNSEKIFNEKTVNIRKREHAFKDFASTYNVEVLNYFD